MENLSMTNVQDIAKRGVDQAVANTAAGLDADVVASLVLNGDLSKLTPTQRVAYYNALCERVGLDPATQPFKLLTLKGKLILYADKGATQQLSLQYKISHDVVAKEKDEDIYTVTIKASMPDGRFTVEDGSVAVLGLKGEDLANARMKAMTKAKRRAVLALLGLGMMDESEIEGLKDAVTVPLPTSIAPTLKTEVVSTETVVKQDDAPTKMDPKQWLQNAIIAIEAKGRVQDKSGAQALGREAKAMLDRQELTQVEFDKVVAAFVAAFPPPPQPALFDGSGAPAEAPTPERKPPVVERSTPEPAPAPKPEPKPKSEAKKAKTVSPAASLMSQIEEASKVSVLLTIKGRIEKGMLTDQERDILVGSLNAKLTQLTGGKK
jgi:hypothetical protein